jgi:NAD(P)-dependent dehydrogenase (short-subunit alcohol dehydrogenase family)
VKEFRGKVAVITGAASGIGRGLAHQCAREGMTVVLADIDDAALAQTAQDREFSQVRVLAVPADVARLSDVQRLAAQTIDAFGAVHLLFNNAGIGSYSTTIWNSTQTDWEAVLGVNLWGVIHGLRVFVPIMLRQGTEGHIVNTASVAGLTQYMPVAPYHVSKHAVVALSENLYVSLEQRQSRVKVSVLCPGFVKTQILEHTRPAAVRNDPHSLQANPEVEAVLESMRQAMEAAMSPEQLASHVFDAIKDEQFYILPHPDSKRWVQQRMEDIVQERNPRLP